ncbi:GldG family protein [Bacteroidota bacterium]
MKNQRTIVYYLLIVVGVLILVNIISDKLFLRLDFTEDNRYTLSNATKDILDNLVEPVTVTAYFSEDLPPSYAKARRDFKELLVEYSNISNGMVVYEFIDPNKDEEKETEANQAGIPPVYVSVREKDQIQQQEAYFGAVIQFGEQNEIIPSILRQRPNGEIYTIPLEYTLSSSIKKLSVIDKPKIGLLQGHGEPSLAAFQQVYSSLSILYSIEQVTLNDTLEQLSQYKTVALVDPKDSIPAYHLAQLDNYLAQGGNLFLAINRVDGDLNNASGKTINTGLETWLTNKGLVVENNFVIDANCVSVGVRQKRGFFSFNSQVQFPYIPIISTFEEHPITKGLEAVVLQFVSSISYVGDTNLTFLPLAKTSEKTGTKSSPTYFDISKQWGESDFPMSNLTIAALLSGNIVGDAESKMVVIGDGNFPVNGEGQNAGQLQEDNVHLMVNSIDWLSDDTGLIELRTKGVTSRPIELIEDGRKVFLKYLNFLLPILLIIIYGIFRMQINRNKRVKRMEEGYV